MSGGAKVERHAVLLAFFFVASLMVPNAVLAFTEDYSLWSKAALFLFPAGIYLMWIGLFKRSGVAVWLFLPVIFCCALQIVLLYLFGNSVAATDMFINIVTTNPGEASELLSNIYPSVILVCLLYLPLLWIAACHIWRRRVLPKGVRKRSAAIGAVLFAAGVLCLLPVERRRDEAVVLTEIFPVNVLYNMELCAEEYWKIERYDETSDGFSFHAHRTARAEGREIYVFIIGEASRAMQWQLYGYDRPTNPELGRRREELLLFKNMLTQSNTTHKSVPMILSSVKTDEHEALYRRKGLPALFREAGFKTWFISNQSPQGAMIDNLVADADSLIYLDHPRLDGQLLDTMKRVIAADRTNDLFFILHCYGSHFSYHQRYPRSFARFVPDGDVSIKLAHAEELRNSYDNSILYTDHFLAGVIDYLKSLDACTAMFYCADHGEDLLDDDRHRFLHASPTTTCYQLHVASFAWFSPFYRRTFPEKCAAAAANVMAPATTHALFQTMADIASIEGDYVSRDQSLVSPEFDRNAPRYYLNDHNKAVPFVETGLTAIDRDYFRRQGIQL